MDKPYKELTGEQTRYLIDTRDNYDARQEIARDLRTRFAGSMGWKKVSGHDYLYRRQSTAWKSLGPRSAETERAFDSFIEGKRHFQDQLEGLDARLEERAAFNKALGLNRVPRTVARILRRLDREGLLGKDLQVVGTNALYAYEGAGAVQFGADEMATEDIDLLYDARRRLKLQGPSLGPKDLIGLLREVDKSFATRSAVSFSAVNRDNFSVDLIVPSDPKFAINPDAAQLDRLAHVPQFSAVAIDDDCMPVRFVAPDPRAFALHKLWLADQPGRNPAKAPRDRAQANAVLTLLRERFPSHPLDPDAPELSALPESWRAKLPRKSGAVAFSRKWTEISGVAGG